MSTPSYGRRTSKSSDRFWDTVNSYGAYGFVYDSVAEITRAVHLVVRGRVVGQHREEGYGLVRVDETLKGEPIARTPGIIEVAGLTWDVGWNGMTAEGLPEDEVILFLMNDAQLLAEGYTVPQSPDARFQYASPNGYQAVLRNVDGRVSVPLAQRHPELADEYPFPLHGTPFDRVLQRIRDTVAPTEP